METRTTPSPQMEQQERPLFLFVVVIGCIITFSGAINGGEHDPVARLLTGIGCGVTCLAQGFLEIEILRRFSRLMRNAAYFSSKLPL
jgi:hypothetical protein